MQAAVAAGERDPVAAAAAGLAELAAAGVEPEYLAIVAADTMEPVASVDGDVLVAVAARVGSVRLIDNVPITVMTPQSPPHGGDPARGANQLEEATACPRPPTRQSPTASTARCR